MATRPAEDHPFGPAVAGLIAEFTRLPGVGKRSAERLAYHILNVSRDEAMGLAEAIREVKTNVQRCGICHNIAQDEVCRLCGDQRRDRQVVCVVEQPKDVTVLEASGSFDGTYHVLGGRIAPLEGVGPEDLSIDSLVKRVKEDNVREIVMATNPTQEGDGTALYLSNVLSAVQTQSETGEIGPPRLTRLARGIATGSVLEFANREMLADAMRGRQAF